VDGNNYFGQLDGKYYWFPELGMETAFEGIWPQMASSQKVITTNGELKF
tara:strand:+ start:132 stop:278 length:147 start_codon:yes stop_codon:yes gene_type:complete